MKTYILTFSFLIALFFSTDVTAQRNKKSKVAVPMDAIEMKVNGLGCPYCSIGFIKKIEKLGDIEDMDTSYETGIFTFKVPASADVTIDNLKEVTKKAGYTLIYAKIDQIEGEDLLFGSLEE